MEDTGDIWDEENTRSKAPPIATRLGQATGAIDTYADYYDEYHSLAELRQHQPVLSQIGIIRLNDSQQDSNDSANV